MQPVQPVQPAQPMQPAQPQAGYLASELHPEPQGRCNVLTCQEGGMVVRNGLNYKEAGLLFVGSRRVSIGASRN